jgi:hypothetical protein
LQDGSDRWVAQGTLTSWFSPPKIADTECSAKTFSLTQDAWVDSTPSWRPLDD